MDESWWHPLVLQQGKTLVFQDVVVELNTEMKKGKVHNVMVGSEKMSVGLGSGRLR